ncbi:MAG: hypothetical protein CL416_04425 [Acidimicrobiaceae bacterium]|nr:hypothetical protein [Acidimicrobiaceae bacterium]
MSVSLAPRTHTDHARTVAEPTDALRMLVRRYAEIVDTRTFDAFDEVFTDEAELETGNGRRVGLDEIRAAMEGLHRYEATDHRVGASTFAVDGERANGTIECEAHHWSTNGSGSRTDRVMTITYHDRYEHTPAGWRLRHRRLDIHRIDEVDDDGLRTR